MQTDIVKNLKNAISGTDNELDEYLRNVEFDDFRDAIKELKRSFYNPKEKYHLLLEEAIKETKEGETFLGRFTELAVKELTDKIKKLEEK